MKGEVAPERGGSVVWDVAVAARAVVPGSPSHHRPGNDRALRAILPTHVAQQEQELGRTGTVLKAKTLTQPEGQGPTPWKQEPPEPGRERIPSRQFDQ
jgi:hypothetical protein